MKIISGQLTYLSIPIIDNMPKFLSKVKNSNHLHSPWVFPPSTESEYIHYINRIQQNNQKGFFIKLISSDEIVGVINLNEIVQGGFQNAYLGFYAFSGYENKGLMSEGLKLLLTHTFENLQLHRVEANIQPANSKSISFIKHHHFRHEGFSPNYLKINGEWKDHERFAFTYEDYLKLKK